MKIRTAVAGAWVLAAGAVLCACSDERPPYFSQQPDYSDPVFQDKPDYFHREPAYNWDDTAKPKLPDNSNPKPAG